MRKFRGKGHCNATLCRAENTIYTAEQYILWESDGDMPPYEGETGFVMHTIDQDGSHRYFDMQGRPISAPVRKGLYIDNGKKYIKK